MKRLIAVLIITFSLLIIVLTQARAESNSKDNENEHNNQTQNASTTSAPKTFEIEEREIGKTITQIKVEEIGKNHPKWKGFEAKGTISNLSSTSFDINGKTIKMDATITGKLQTKGILANGAFVKVEGKTIDGTYYAKEIKVENKGGEENEDENEINDDDSIITPSVSPTPEVSVSPTPNATPSPTGTVETSGNQLKVTISGTIQEIIEALEDLLNTLKSQVSAV